MNPYNYSPLFQLNNLLLKMMQIHYCLDGCEHELTDHQNKAVDLNRIIIMESLTPKDYKAINIGLNCGIDHFALSFCESNYISNLI